MIKYKSLQGTDLFIPCKENTATLVLFDGINKHTSTNVIGEEGNYQIGFTADETKLFASGKYSYQLIADNALEDSGTIKIQANLLYSTDIDSYWRRVLKAVDDRIAGKALDSSAESISVGDKSIRYLSMNELFKLRDFALQKIAEEDEEEGDEAAESPNNEKKILFVWR